MSKDANIGCSAISVAVSFFPCKSIVSSASVIKHASIVESTSLRAACAKIPRAEALSRATGFLDSSQTQQPNIMCSLANQESRAHTLE